MKWGVTMNNTTHMSGMGCFAKSQTLQQQLKRILENYTRLRYEDLCPEAERISNDRNGIRFFRSVIRLGTRRPDQIDRALEWISAATEISGFYIGLNGPSLHLMLFFQSEAGHSNKLNIRLENLARLRANRLH